MKFEVWLSGNSKCKKLPVDTAEQTRRPEPSVAPLREPKTSHYKISHYKNSHYKTSYYETSKHKSSHYKTSHYKYHTIKPTTIKPHAIKPHTIKPHTITLERYDNLMAYHNIYWLHFAPSHFVNDSTTRGGQGLHLVESSRSHSDAPHSAELLWRRIGPS